MKRFSKKLLMVYTGGMLSLLGFSAKAQMAEAQKQTINVSKTTTYNVSPSEVWEIVSKVNQVESYANGYVSSSVTNGSEFPITRTMKFKSGVERKDVVQQLNEPYKFYCFNITSLPQGIEEATLACTITLNETDSNKSDVKWWAIVKGNAESKKKLIAEIENEFDNYAEGLKKLLNK
ncbi:hypothetical protein NF867_08245 [Solitalea sp. MAHUQ-68]|uniref:SRPBCC family protein n=1 Tax=Solitalea agri TaxID=2953739 RepID=A0A9X2F1B1_9SPHI|nr:hypothetical protein [Solitalea agri]MCO4292847.1 hypothetical protein [Solitalea agri]